MRVPRCLRIPRAPDVVIGGADDPYLRRWWVIPRNPFFNIFLHHFLRSDDPRALHDHPWANLSILLRGRYWEILPHGAFRMRRPFWPVLRRSTSAHRVQLLGGANPQPVWTLFITGPKVRDWGYLCPQGWRHSKDFTFPGNSTLPGPGCD